LKILGLKIQARHVQLEKLERKGATHEGPFKSDFLRNRGSK
jgi:hypothetical protein